MTWTSRQDLRGRRTRRCTTALSASPARSLRTTPTRARTSPRWRARRRSTARCVSPRRVRRRRSRSTTAFQSRASASERNTRRPVVSPRFVNAGGRNRALVFSFFLKWFRVIQRDASLPTDDVVFSFHDTRHRDGMTRRRPRRSRGSWGTRNARFSYGRTVSRFPAASATTASPTRP